jgi:integrase
LNIKHINEDFLRALHKMAIRAGRNAGLTIHSLRHSFKAICINAGIPRDVTDTWQVHAPVCAASSAYYRLSDEESQRFIRLAPFRQSTRIVQSTEFQKGALQ